MLGRIRLSCSATDLVLGFVGLDCGGHTGRRPRTQRAGRARRVRRRVDPVEARRREPRRREQRRPERRRRVPVVPRAASATRGSMAPRSSAAGSPWGTRVGGPPLELDIDVDAQHLSMRTIRQGALLGSFTAQKTGALFQVTYADDGGGAAKGVTATQQVPGALALGVIPIDISGAWSFRNVPDPSNVGLDRYGCDATLAARNLSGVCSDTHLPSWVRPLRAGSRQHHGNQDRRRSLRVRRSERNLERPAPARSLHIPVRGLHVRLRLRPEPRGHADHVLRLDRERNHDQWHRVLGETYVRGSSRSRRWPDRGRAQASSLARSRTVAPRRGGDGRGARRRDGVARTRARAAGAPGGAANGARRRGYAMGRRC